MRAWRKLKYLLPSCRRAEERDMQEELASLAAIAGRRELGNLTAVAVASLALAVAGNAAIFSPMDALLWRDLPVREPQRLVLLDRYSLSYLAYSRFAENAGRAIEGVFACTSRPRRLDAGAGAQRGTVELVSGSYFATLGLEPLLGRRILIGRPIWVEQSRFTVIGVAPPEFFGLRVGSIPDVWIPLSMAALRNE